MPVDTELDTPPTTTATRPFKQVADEAPGDSRSAGYSVMEEMGEQARREKDKKANGFFSRAAGEGGNGFSLAGKDSSGNGFTAPLNSHTMLGKKWAGFKRTWYLNDQRTMQFAGELNPGFDRIIKRALKNNWTHIGIQVGVTGKIPAPPPLARALHRRIQELASGSAEANQAIKAMGFRPDMVRAQLAAMSAHSGHINEVFEAMQKAAPSGAGPTVTPP